MDDILREMVDHHQIRKLLSEYCHGCDRRHELNMASVYAEDSWDDHGNKKMPGPDFAKSVMEDQIRNGITLHHHLGQSIINVEGDRAGAETYFIASLRKRGATEILDVLGGRYIDELVREGAGWKIKKRTAVRDWSITQPITADRLAALQFVDGSDYRSDVGTQVLRKHGSSLGG